MVVVLTMKPEKANPFPSTEELRSAFNGFNEEEQLDTEFPATTNNERNIVKAEINGSNYKIAVNEGPTVARQELENDKVYWITDGEQTYWVKNEEWEEAENLGLETLKQTVDQILEEDAEETNLSYEENPGLYNGRIGKVLPKSHVRGLSEDIQEGYADLSEYIPSNFDTDPTSEDLARQLARNLRREGLEPSRNGSEIQL